MNFKELYAGVSFIAFVLGWTIGVAIIAFISNQAMDISAESYAPLIFFYPAWMLLFGLVSGDD